MKQKYILAYLDMAERFGQTSEATRLKVGALLVKNDCIISQGTNGNPPKWHTEVCEDEYGKTLPTVRHAEVAALEKLQRSHESSVGATMFISHAPCEMCAIKIVGAGIKEVYYRHVYRCDKGIEYLQRHGVFVKRIE